MTTLAVNTHHRPGPVRWLRIWITRCLARPLRRGSGTRRFRAAIVKVDRLGDFVLALSAIRHALSHFGEDQCLLIISPYAVELAEQEFPRTPRMVLSMALGHRSLWQQGMKARALLQKVSCDEVVCFRHQRWDWDELILLWLGARRCHVLDDVESQQYFAAQTTFRFQYPDGRISLTASSSQQLQGSALLCRELWLHQQLLAAAIGRSFSADEILPRFSCDLGQPFARGIVVSPYSSRAIKDIPEKVLMSALREAQLHTSDSITLHGDSNQRERMLGLEARLRAGGVRNVSCAPTVRLSEFIRVVHGSRLVLTADTVTAHIAAALDRPAVVLIGGGHFGQFGPWRRSGRQIWLTNQLDCFGCNWSCIYPEPYCLTRIALDSVRVAVAGALKEGASA